MNLDLTVTTDQGSWTVTADLRDQARWEQYAHKNGLPVRIVEGDQHAPATLFLMHLAWTASKRAGRYSEAFPSWLDACSGVDATETAGVDPTQPVAGPG